MHLNLLIFFVVLSGAIIGIISSENNTTSSNLLLRERRVVHLDHNREELVRSGTFSFTVNIKIRNAHQCVGTIISLYTVITAASCATEPLLSLYKVISGSVDIYRGAAHNVIQKKIRIGNHSRARPLDGIALLIVDSHFQRIISIANLYVGPVMRGIEATVLGWGCYYSPNERGTNHPSKLRAITVPIMDHRECLNVYRDFLAINDEDICVYDPQKHCGNTDAGAPLVIDGQLAGIYLRRAENQRERPSPEVFVLLQHAHYNRWISDEIVY